MFSSTFKSYNINLDTRNEGNTVYSGDILTGQVSFEITKTIKITSITMLMKGIVHVHWTSGSRKHRRHHSEKRQFFNFNNVILNEVSGETTELPPGIHLYPFTCQLPHGDFPSSFRGVFGEVVYSLTVGINRPWHLSKEFVTQLNFRKRIDTNQPDLWAPLSGTANKTLCCLWCASGPITLTGSVDKKVYTLGETVEVHCTISNHSSQEARPTVKLQQKQVYFEKDRIQRRMIVKNLASGYGPIVSPHTSGVHSDVSLIIPPSAGITIANCSLLDVSYMIELNLSIKLFHDLTILFPIILCESLE